MNSQELWKACDQNYRAAFAALVPNIAAPCGGTRSFGPADAIVTGLPSAFYNPVFVTDTDVTIEEVCAAVEWVRSRSVAASVQLRLELQDRFEPALRELGLAPDPWITPGMALYPVPPIPPLSGELRRELVEARTFEDWHTGIGYGANFRSVYRPTLLDDPAFRLLVGYVDDEPVTGAAAILSDGVAGIYAVGTAERARRRGFGRAATWAAVAAGCAEGCEIAVLQSTEVAVNMYRAMGFVEVCRYLEWMPQADR